MNDFLKIEYEQCLLLLKYYDERHQSLVKFSVGLASGVPSLLLGFYGMGGSILQHFWKFASLVSGVTALCLLAIFTVMIQVRLYFVYPARQVNALRKVGLASVSDQFQNNQMYLNTSFSAFKWTSAHSLLNAFVSLQIGVFVGLSVFGAFVESMNHQYLIGVIVICGVLVAGGVFAISSWYLHAKSQYHPDVSIHNGRGQNEQS